MSGGVDSRLYELLQQKSWQSVVHPPWCVYEEKEGAYEVLAWGEKVKIYPQEQRLSPEVEHSTGYDFFSIFLINYLLGEKRAAPMGQWISENDLPGGNTFFRGPHAIPTDTICSYYGNDLEKLRSRCLQMGGRPLTLADLSCSFTVTGSIRLALLYWLGDEDFPAEAKILLDAGVKSHLALDVIYALLCDCCHRLACKKS